MRAKNLDLEILRGLAIVLVFLFHLDIAFFRNGFLGVDAFFVLSGFLMAKIYTDLESSERVADYLNRRLFRLLPAYLAVIAVSIAVVFVRSLPHEASSVAEDMVWSTLLMPNHGFWNDSTYFSKTLFRPLLNFWSLGVEIQFYFVYPALLWLQRRWRPTLPILGVLSFALWLAMNEVSPKSAFFLLPTRLWEFLVGYLVASRASDESSSTGMLGGFALLALLGATFFGPGIGSSEASYLVVPVAVLAGAVIHFGLPGWGARSILGQFLILLGKYSYSIYLVHFPVIILVNYVPFGGNRLAPESWTDIGLIIVLTGALSLLLYHFVETPFRKKKGLGKLALAAGFAFSASLVVSTLSDPISGIFTDPEERTLSLALEDRTYWRCGKVARVLEPLSETCDVRPTGDGPHYLLVGDSHADAIKEGLLARVSDQGGTLRFFKQSMLIRPGSLQTILSEARTNAIDVVVAHTSPGQNSFDAVDSLAAKLGESGIRLVYINPVPTYPASVPMTLYRDLKLDDTAGRFEPISLAEYSEKNRRELKYSSMLEEAHLNVTVQHPARLICQPRCRIREADEGPLYYFDNNHLTLTGARLLDPLFEEIVSLTPIR